jgi:mannose-6-phosphate isomerase
VHLGFSRDVDAEELGAWIKTQNIHAMIETTNTLAVQPGDAIYCPAGLPQAIGAGVFFAETQEPTDFAVLFEWQGFNLDGPSDGQMGLGSNWHYSASTERGGRPDACPPCAVLDRVPQRAPE